MRSLVPIIAALAIVALVAFAVLDRSPAASELTGTTWRWTASTAGPGAAPSAVPDPARYTIEFRPDRTFSATADCASVSGTYVVIPPGRRGPVSSLEIQRRPDTPVSCGADSLASLYVWGLDQAGHEWVVDGRLTITLRDGGTMVFE